MKIAVFGTGMVGQTLAAKLLKNGHDVAIGTRYPQATLAKTEPDGYGNPPFAQWLQTHSGAKLLPFAAAAAHGEVILNATNGAASIPALTSAGAANLRGKIILDIANPLDFSKGMPPSLFVSNTDSLAEQIQRAFPESKVVKTLNTLNAHLMANPADLAGGNHDIFLSGNDAEAKKSAAAHLQSWFGWKPESIIDLGDITTARGTEMLLPIWIRLWGAIGSPMFNFKIVR